MVKAGSLTGLLIDYPSLIQHYLCTAVVAVGRVPFASASLSFILSHSHFVGPADATIGGASVCALGV